MIDPDAAACASVRQILTLVGGFGRVAAFATARDARSELPLLRPALVVIDPALPGEDGPECIRRLKTLCPETKLIVATTKVEGRSVLAALGAGVDGYLSKPFQPAECLAAIRLALAGGIPLSEAVARRLCGTFPGTFECPLRIGRKLAAPAGAAVPEAARGNSHPDPRLGDGRGGGEGRATRGGLGERRKGIRPLCPCLSARQQDVMRLLSSGKLYKEIAAALGVSICVVHKLLSRAYRTLGVQNRTEAVCCLQALREAGDK
ncbi:MAG: response regulator transcription factor [Verrucomicrobia bacterium]|nr:response regulator transcription factor [Verrucomicrobiota bacterium]